MSTFPSHWYPPRTSVMIVDSLCFHACCANPVFRQCRYSSCNADDVERRENPHRTSQCSRHASNCVVVLVVWWWCFVLSFLVSSSDVVFCLVARAGALLCLRVASAESVPVSVSSLCPSLSLSLFSSCLSAWILCSCTVHTCPQALVTVAPTHSCWLKSYHKTELHLTWRSAVKRSHGWKRSKVSKVLCLTQTWSHQQSSQYFSSN